MNSLGSHGGIAIIKTLCWCCLILGLGLASSHSSGADVAVVYSWSPNNGLSVYGEVTGTQGRMQFTPMSSVSGVPSFFGSPTGGFLGGVTTDGTIAYVLQQDRSTVSKLDLYTGQMVGTIALSGTVTDIAMLNGTLYGTIDRPLGMPTPLNIVSIDSLGGLTTAFTSIQTTPYGWRLSGRASDNLLIATSAGSPTVGNRWWVACTPNVSGATVQPMIANSLDMVVRTSGEAAITGGAGSQVLLSPPAGTPAGTLSLPNTYGLSAYSYYAVSDEFSFDYTPDKAAVAEVTLSSPPPGAYATRLFRQGTRSWSTTVSISNTIAPDGTAISKGVTSLPAAFCVKLGKLSELRYTRNGLCVMLG